MVSTKESSQKVGVQLCCICEALFACEDECRERCGPFFARAAPSLAAAAAARRAVRPSRRDLQGAVEGLSGQTAAAAGLRSLCARDRISLSLGK